MGIGAILVVGVWLALFDLAVSGLVIANTLRGIEPVSLLFAVSVLCALAYVGLVVLATRRVVARKATVGGLPRWLAARLLVVGLAFVSLAVIAMAAV